MLEGIPIGGMVGVAAGVKSSSKFSMAGLLGLFRQRVVVLRG
jgi:hypothetical protein